MTTECHLPERDRDGASGFPANTLYILPILYNIHLTQENSVEVSQITTLYLGWEKTTSTLFIAVGLLGIAAAYVCWQKSGSEIFRWSMYPLAIFASLSLIVGCTIFFRTDAQLASLLALAQSDPSAFFQQELARMSKVNNNWATYKWIELLVIVPSLLILMAFVDKPAWFGLAVATLLVVVPLLVLDVIGERNGLWYVEQLVISRGSISIS